MPPRKRTTKGKKAAAPPPPPSEHVDQTLAPSSTVEEVSLKSTESSGWSTDDFSNEVVVRILADDFHNNLEKLDNSGYFEKYLWKHVSAESGFEHVFSILLMLNAKFAEEINVVEVVSSSDLFEAFFAALVRHSSSTDVAWSYEQKVAVLYFLINIFKFLEDEIIRRTALRYVSLPLWDSLSPERLAAELEDHSHLKKHWDRFCEEKTQSDEGPQDPDHDGDSETLSEPPSKGKRKGRKSNTSKSPNKKARSSMAADTSSSSHDPGPSQWIPSLLTSLLHTVEADGGLTGSDKDAILYVERFLEFLIDLVSQLPTRRFLSVLLDDMHLIVRLRRTALFASSETHAVLFRQLVNLLDDFLHFEVEDQTGRALSAEDVSGMANARLHALQRVAYAHYGQDMQDLIFSSTGELGREENLRKHFSLLNPEQLLDIAQRLGHISSSKLAKEPPPSVDFVTDVLLYRLSTRRSQLEALSHTSLYPTEKLLWDPNSVPLGKHYNGKQVLALPKLNLQFLTVHDYLLRNFTLFRLESAYEIRQDLVDAIKRVAPRQSLSGVVSFGGWARMALPIISFGIEEVTKPNLGELVPGRVSCGVEIDLTKFQGEIRGEWESLREHDVVFLVSIKNPSMEVGNVTGKFEQ